MSSIVAAVITVDGQRFRGQTHSMALLAAIEQGTLDPSRLEVFNPDGINTDLFLTSDGRLIDRYRALEEFDAASSETAHTPSQPRRAL